MYQVFVVEDELLIRQSIRNVIEKMHGPFTLCGEASDGEMALAMMQDLMPDILLTDIRMPFLDGFELIRNCKAMMPWLKVAIISGFGDFESAQKAISLGVDQYLLKPVRQADLVRVVEEMAEQIEKEKTANRSVSGGLDDDEVMTVLRQHFVRQLIYGEADTGKLLDRMRRLDLDIMRTHYMTAVCSFDSPDIDHRVLQNTVGKILDGSRSILCYFNNPDRMTLLAYDNDPAAMNERVYQVLNILRHELQEICPVITTVISSDVQRLAEISDACKAAADLLKTVSSIAPGQVINVNDTARLASSIIRLDGPFGEEFRQKIKHALPEDAEQLLNDEFSSAEGTRFNSFIGRYRGLVNLLRIAVQKTARLNQDADEKDIAAQLSSRYDFAAAAGNKDRFRETASALLRQILGIRKEDPGEIKYHHVISLAEQYIRENYCDQNISLISVANHVAMSAAYFSTVFSQTTGSSFIAYLTTMRIEKAKELLSSTNMKLSDIALEIGYNEPNYFSHVFRKSTGMTPKEYRIQNQK